MGPGSGRGKQTGTAAAGKAVPLCGSINTVRRHRLQARRLLAKRLPACSFPPRGSGPPLAEQHSGDDQGRSQILRRQKDLMPQATPKSGVNTGISLVQAAACPARAGASWPFPAMGWKMIFPTTYGTRSKTSRIPPGTRHGGGENCMLMRTAITTSSLARPDAPGRCAVASSSGRGRG